MVRFSKTFSSAVLLLLVMQSADCVPSRHGREYLALASLKSGPNRPLFSEFALSCQSCYTVTWLLARLESLVLCSLQGAFLDSFGKKPKPKPTSKLVLRAQSEKWNVWRTKNGLQTLSETLEKSLVDRGVEIRKNVKIEGALLRIFDDKVFEVLELAARQY